MEVESSKAILELTSPAAGFVLVHCEEDVDVAIGTVLCEIGESRYSSVDSAVGAKESSEERHPRFSKKASELIAARCIGSEAFEGLQFVRERDVFAAVGEAPDPGSRVERGGRSRKARASDECGGVPYTTQRLSPSKRAEGRLLRTARDQSVQAGVTTSIRVPGLMEGARAHPHMGGSITPLLVYEVARLLRKYPILNAFCDGDSACLYEDVNVGVAVDSGESLRVPVIHRADARGLAAISQDVREALVDYVEGRLTPEQVTGGTFTIADLSGEGVLLNHPVLNQDQSAILGVGSDRGRDDVDILNFTLAYDHRLTEGVTATRFLRDLEHRLVGHQEALRQIAGDEFASGEPTCQRCFRGVAELERQNHFVVQTLGRDGQTVPICSSCLQGW